MLSHPKRISAAGGTPSISLSSSPLQSPGPLSPRPSDHRRSIPSASPSKHDFGFIWMSVPKNYRSGALCSHFDHYSFDSRQSSDDGIFTGLLFGPIIACALLASSLRLVATSAPTLPAAWLIEPPAELTESQNKYPALQALVLARLSLLNLATFCSSILLLHVCASWWLEARFTKPGHAAEGERASVPRSEGLRSWYYIVFTLCVSAGLLGLKALLDHHDLPLWKRQSLHSSTPHVDNDEDDP